MALRFYVCKENIHTHRRSNYYTTGICETRMICSLQLYTETSHQQLLQHTPQQQQQPKGNSRISAAAELMYTETAAENRQQTPTNQYHGPHGSRSYVECRANRAKPQKRRTEAIAWWCYSGRRQATREVVGIRKTSVSFRCLLSSCGLAHWHHNNPRFP